MVGVVPLARSSTTTSSSTTATRSAGSSWDGEPEAEEKWHAYRLAFPPQEHKIDHGGRRSAHARRRTRSVDDEHGHRHGCCAAQNRADEPLPTGLTPGAADRRLGAARGAGAVRAGVSRRRRGRHIRRLRLVQSSSGACRTRGSTSTRSTAALSLGGQLPVRPGPARLGQDLAGRADGGRADAAGQARRRHLAQPQGDPQPARARSSTRRASRASRFRGVKQRRTRRRRRASRGRSSTRRRTGSDCLDPTSSSSSPARRGCFARDGHSTRRRSTCCSSTRPASSRSPTCSRSARARAPSSCSATRTSCRRSRRARSRTRRGRLGAPAPARRCTRRCRPTAGIFLDETWRLRPELCALHLRRVLRGSARCRARVTARRSLAGRGRARSARRSSTSGRGPVVGGGGGRRRGRDRAAARDAVHRRDGVDAAARREDDVLVVAPYNAQVRTLRRDCPAASRRHGRQVPGAAGAGRHRLDGELDGEDAPRGIGFAFDRHRFNVATSRAQCRAVLVCSPRAARRRLQDDRADAARERGLPVRRARHPCACLKAGTTGTALLGRAERTWHRDVSRRQTTAGARLP